MVVRRLVACGPVLLANPYFLYNLRIALKYTIPSTTYSSSLSASYYPRRVSYNFNRNLTTTTTTSPSSSLLSNTTGLNDNNDLKIDLNDPIITRINQDPKLLASIQEFSQILKSKGVDLSTGQMPSMLQMARLATDGQVKQKLNNLNKELKNAGIEFNAETAQKYMMFAPKEAEESPKTLHDENIPPIITTQEVPKSVATATTKIEPSSSIISSPQSSSSSSSSSSSISMPQSSTFQSKESSKSTSALATNEKSTKESKQENVILTKIKKESTPKHKHQEAKQPEKIASELTEKLKEEDSKEKAPVGFLSKIKSLFKMM